MLLTIGINHDLGRDLSVPVSRTDCRWRVIVKDQGRIQVFRDLYAISESYIRGTDERTRGDALMRSQASPYNTVAEFLEKSSDVKEYTRRTERPAPNKMTPRFVVRAVVRRTARDRM